MSPVPRFTMSLSHTAAEYMLSDALLPDPSSSRAKGLRLELPSDRLLKFVTVGLPLCLVSLAFAREFSAGELWLFQSVLCVTAAVWLLWQTPLYSWWWCDSKLGSPVVGAVLPRGYLLIVFNG